MVGKEKNLARRGHEVKERREGRKESRKVLRDLEDEICYVLKCGMKKRGKSRKNGAMLEF